MKDSLASVQKQISSATLSTKVVLGVAVLALIGVFAFANSWASRPSFTLLYSDLDAQHAAAVQGALAGANVRFQVSQPPAPFVIHVDEGQVYVAQNAVALAGALDSAPEGIQTNGSGASQVFLSASERAQHVQKREWQELEKQLEVLDFVLRARVSTSTPDPSPLRKSTPMTVAVTLTLEGGNEISKSQAATVAKLVRYRFNVPPENVVISDQSGRSLFEAPSTGDGAESVADLLDHRRRHDEDLVLKTNQALERVFGSGMAYVVVNSEWTYDQIESVKETVDPKNKVVVQETTSKTTTPVDAASSGIAGTSSNLTAEFGATNAAVPPVATAPAKETLAESSESQKSTVVGRETQLRKSSAPVLAHLSVSLFLDESLRARLSDVETSVKASVGFDSKRGDSFSSLAAPFATVKRDDAGKPIAPAPPVEAPAPSRVMETLLQRGIEIAAAIAFLFVLWKTIKSLPKQGLKTALSGAGDAPMPDGRTLELLAKSEIEELVKSDPARVSSILSRWAAEEEPVGKEAAR
jgi:flagellar M-ring protein FliF